MLRMAERSPKEWESITTTVQSETLENGSLVFVYNANSGLFNTVADAAHKVISPQTYGCNLCALTHSTFGMRKSWQEFLAALDVPLEFLHADELQKLYSITGLELPAIFRKQGKLLRLLIAADLINRCLTIDELKQLVRDHL